MDQEQIMQLQVMEQEFNQLNQQLQLIEQNISEMHELRESLDEIELMEDKEMLANLGKKIYIPVEVKEKKLIVEVGNKNFVKKTIPETKKIIDDQTKKLIIGKENIKERLGTLQIEIEGLIKGIQDKEKKGKKSQ